MYSSRLYYIDFDCFLSESNLIGGSTTTQRNAVHLFPVVLVDIRFGGGPAPFRHTLQSFLLRTGLKESSPY